MTVKTGTRLSFFCTTSLGRPAAVAGAEGKVVVVAAAAALKSKRLVSVGVSAVHMIFSPALRRFPQVTVTATGCPGDETPCSVCTFLIPPAGPTGADRMSRLRRILFPVTGQGFF